MAAPTFRAPSLVHAGDADIRGPTAPWPHTTRKSGSGLYLRDTTLGEWRIEHHQAPSPNVRDWLDHRLDRRSHTHAAGSWRPLGLPRRILRTATRGARVRRGLGRGVCCSWLLLSQYKRKRQALVRPRKTLRESRNHFIERMLTTHHQPP